MITVLLWIALLGIIVLRLYVWSVDTLKASGIMRDADYKAMCKRDAGHADGVHHPHCPDSWWKTGEIR